MYIVWLLLFGYNVFIDYILLNEFNGLYNIYIVLDFDNLIYIFLNNISLIVN